MDFTYNNKLKSTYTNIAFTTAVEIIITNIG